jgi:hypothetical protein
MYVCDCITKNAKFLSPFVTANKKNRCNNKDICAIPPPSKYHLDGHFPGLSYDLAP